MLHNKQIVPKVSVVLPTFNRPYFLDIAVELFNNQDYPFKELIIVDDSKEQCRDYSSENIKHYHLNERMLLGKKMNWGIKKSVGDYIFKMDDDDFYGNSFISENLNSYPTEGDFILFHQPFIFFDLKNWEMKVSDKKRCSGATFFFKKEIWNRVKFRDVLEAVDAYFLLDYHDIIKNGNVKSIYNPYNFLQIRHDIHTWNKMPNGKSFKEYLRECNHASITIEEIISQSLIKKYETINNKLTSNEKH